MYSFTQLKSFGARCSCNSSKTGERDVNIQSSNPGTRGAPVQNDGKSLRKVASLSLIEATCFLSENLDLRDDFLPDKMLSLLQSNLDSLPFYMQLCWSRDEVSELSHCRCAFI